MDIGLNLSNLENGQMYIRGKECRYLIKDVIGIAYRGNDVDIQTLVNKINN